MTGALDTRHPRQGRRADARAAQDGQQRAIGRDRVEVRWRLADLRHVLGIGSHDIDRRVGQADVPGRCEGAAAVRSEEHTSELQSLMRISYAVFCLKKKK